eukprot:scaffold104476_cov67-Phaeocystis_antarctica.AAC.4
MRPLSRSSSCELGRTSRITRFGASPPPTLTAKYSRRNPSSGSVEVGADQRTRSESIVTNSAGQSGAAGRSGGCSCCSVHRSRKPPGRSTPPSEWKMSNADPASDTTDGSARFLSPMRPLSASSLGMAATEAGSLPKSSQSLALPDQVEASS